MAKLYIVMASGELLFLFMIHNMCYVGPSQAWFTREVRAHDFCDRLHIMAVEI